MLIIFKKVVVNIPLLEVIREGPRYARSLKELCTKKVRYESRVFVGENISAILQKNMPGQCCDPGMIFILCVIK